MKLKKRLLVLATLTGLISSPALAKASLELRTMEEIYQEELIAQEIYQQMIEKFDNDSYYSRIYQAELNHAGIIKRLLESYGHEAPDLDPTDLKINDDELQALKYAYEFELEDINMLDKAISQTSDESQIRAYEKLKFGSSNHAMSLERAIKAYESGQKDLLRISPRQDSLGKKSNRQRAGLGWQGSKESKQVGDAPSWSRNKI